ncbi:hypothetical protein DFP72DRAFT_1066658 [Ephemerocybe angulata]|uniref:DUF7330 domain-containing protein n=1 Tax=Ephemerocybe angulata TaxID=980116 RepID=A0A8H6I0C1_9AGAR|nr:hypothetical protein DFP72DRAFT_1066658 [Tulosesus angulatus]
MVILPDSESVSKSKADLDSPGTSSEPYQPSNPDPDRDNRDGPIETVISGDDTDEPPPFYTVIPATDETSDSTPDASAASSSWLKGVPLPKPTNTVSFTKRNGALKGQWVIDPGLVVPSSLLPALSAGETEEARRNLYVKAHNGALAAVVHLIPRPTAPDGRTRTTFEASTLNGSVKFALFEAVVKSCQPRRLPISLKLETLNGAIHIGIPRSFKGTIIGKTLNGGVKLSNDVEANVAYDTADGFTRRIFVGELVQDGSDPELENCDQIKADTKNGAIKIRYVDEGEIQTECTSERPRGVVGRLEAGDPRGMGRRRLLASKIGWVIGLPWVRP